MTGSFLRLVDSLDELKKDGTSTEFFTGENYVYLSREYVDAVEDFSLKNFKREEISKPESEEVDKLTPYVLYLGDQEEKEVLSQFYTLIENKILQSIKENYKQIIAITDRENSHGNNALFNSDLHDEFDSLGNAIRLRDFLVHIKHFVKLQKKNRNKDAALIIQAKCDV